LGSDRDDGSALIDKDSSCEAEGAASGDLCLHIDGEAFQCFVDRPLCFVSETSLDERDVTALFDARIRCGELIDYLSTDLPSPLDLPDAETFARWHDDLIAAAEHGQAAGQGPARTVRINAENASHLARPSRLGFDGVADPRRAATESFSVQAPDLCHLLERPQCTAPCLTDFLHWQ
jgi:hypothetical protein